MITMDNKKKKKSWTTHKKISELQALKWWKQIYSMPNHCGIYENYLVEAQIGILPSPSFDDETNKILSGKYSDVKQLQYLGRFPLLLVLMDKKHYLQIHSIHTVNKYYSKRSLYSDFQAVKKGLYSEELCREYANV